jgi:uncharacterized protein YjbI with pentapeptide repeats
MANELHLQILQQGTEAWNEWRDRNPEIQPDLSDAELGQKKLSKVNFRNVNLTFADLTDADLSGAILSDAHLVGASLEYACLAGASFKHSIMNMADFMYADLSSTALHYCIMLEANFICANLTNANLYLADLREARLIEANLAGANLFRANFVNANLRGANLERAVLCDTVLANADLSQAKGLSTCQHRYPSVLDYRTFIKSGSLPLEFLRGCGLPDTLINYLPSLLNEAIQFYSCFISYSSKDQSFAERLHADLQNKGVRCWFAPEDLRIGDKIRMGIDESIKKYDKLLLILSRHSVTSDWVEQEVETALSKERDEKRVVLFPIRLDDTVMQAKTGWPALLKNSRNIGEFQLWKDHDAYQKAFARLLRDLRTEQAPQSPA